MNKSFRALCVELVAIDDALMGGATLASNQGQALDGYSALANFRLLANRARAALADEPAVPPLYARQTSTGQWEGADHPSGPWRKVLPADLARCHPAPAPGLNTIDPDWDVDRELVLAQPEPEVVGVSDEELREPLGDLIDKWCQEGMQVKPHGTSFPLAHYVASKAYQYGLCKGRPAKAPAGEVADLTPEHTSRRTEGDLHPEVREAYRYVDSVVATADFEHPLAWCGWALREAFLAGCTRARAALADEPAAPEGREPAAVTGQPSDGEGPKDADLHAMAFSYSQPCYQFEYIPYARAVLTRWGNPAPAPPADGEVAELVAALQSQAIQCTCDQLTSGDLRRAAELLQRQALVPVSVSERLPGDQLCWWFESDEEGEAYGSSWTLLRIRGGVSGYTHWLPAHALPLPEGGE